jgi:hypothetical protein
LSSAQAEVVLDGVRNAGEGYTESSVQETRNNWGTNNFLGNLHYVQSGNLLHVHVGARAAGNAVILFIDAKPGGVEFIPSNLITAGGEEYAINNLGASTLSGMTFEDGFTPELAVRVFGNGSDAFVNRYNFLTGVRTYSGQANAATISDGPISGLRVNWVDVPVVPETDPAEYDHQAATNGIEMALNLSELGVPGGNQVVKVMAILVNGNSDYASNQVLASRISSTADIGNNRNTINFQDEDGIQTISIPVTGQGLDPNGDEDADGFTNGNEVAGAAPPDGLGYVSDPLIPNFTNMAVAGSFNAWNAADSGTSMTQGDTGSLVEQYHWTLDRVFNSPAQAIQYKFVTGGSFDVNWGQGAGAGIVARNGGDINGFIGAAGVYRIFFNQGALTHTLQRRTFGSYDEFRAAYGLEGEDPGLTANANPNDGWTDYQNYTAGTHPLVNDTDGDGMIDSLDPEPLVQRRDITFSVDMNVQIAEGDFVAGDDVRLLVFNGPATNFENPLTGGGYQMEDADNDGIYTLSAPIEDVPGFQGQAFGDYKFFFVSQDENSALVGNYEQVSENPFENRTVPLGAPEVLQVVPTVFFSNDAGTPENTFEAWVNSITWPQGADTTRSGDPDFDGHSNLQEYLFGQSPIVPNPSLSTLEAAAGTLTIRFNALNVGATYQVVENDDLAGDWTASAGVSITDAPDQAGVPAGYTRKVAVITIAGARNFFRILGAEVAQP